MKKPGKASNTDLATRMKTYEAVNDYSLIPRIPVYVRLDMRAGHTFCRGLNKPFDMDYVKTIQETAKYLCEKTNAKLAYCQSDEISLCWENTDKIPFEGRLFKLQSVFASMASAAFIMNGLKTSLKDRIEKFYPTFDCRVMQCTIDEVCNAFVWREQDCIKNSITMVALSKFSTKQIDKKNSLDKVNMLKESFGIDYYKDIPENLQRGSYFRRELYMKKLTDEEIANIPVANLPTPDCNGDILVTRSRISEFNLGMPLRSVANKIGVIFNNETPVAYEKNN